MPPSDSELSELRAAIRSGRFRSTTSGRCPHRVQANLVVLPESFASDFRAFCEANPRPCPLIEVTRPGSSVPEASAPEADLRTDAPRYRVYRYGRLIEEPTDLRSLWRSDLVSFLLGCSFNFERALSQAGIPIRHQEERKVVPMYVTNRPCEPRGCFSGPLVVSMRPIPEGLVSKASGISGRYPASHGEPVHVGDPGALGIRDLAAPDYGESVTLRTGELPVFWACGVTPQAVAREARPELLLTHAPGHMFITDLANEPSFPSAIQPL